VDLSGIIFVVLAVAWAVYLIPKALKHHDEVARTRSVERFSNAMRVLARREPVNRRDTRLVVTPSRPAGSARVITPAPATPAAATARSAAKPAERAAARAAARRRRRILLGLLLIDAAVIGVAAFALVPWWSVAIPSVLTLLYLFLCRTQVRRQSEAVWAPAAGDTAATEGAIAPRRAIRVDAPYGNPRRSVGPDEEETVTLSAASLRAAAGASSLAEAEAAAVHAGQQQTVAVTVTTVDGESLWDPLPVTLPTYVGKAKAARTVRTIDLNGPDAWTSGRSAEDSRLVEEANASAASASAPSEDTAAEQRAVGS
jgi:hypothetical protein